MYYLRELTINWGSIVCFFLGLNLSACHSLGTHYIQDINVTISDMEPGQIDISCRFLVNSSLAMGYLAIIYSQESDVYYLITENQDQDFMINMLSGLSNKEYYVLLYTIDKSGLPLKQAAGFPQTVFVDNQLDFSGIHKKFSILREPVHLDNSLDDVGTDDTSQPVHNVSSVVVQNETNLCVHCTFHDDSASACVVIYYTFASAYYDVITLNVWKIDRVEQEACDCVEVIADHIAVYAFSSEKKMIYGQPLNYSYVRYNINQGMYTVSLSGKHGYHGNF